MTEEEEVSGLPPPSGPSSGISARSHAAPLAASKQDDVAPASPPRKSPIAELLYMRWLEGLKLKWPLSS